MIIVLTGATGTGKSKMALSLAKKTGYAIVNADAYQVYKELNIATAKPTKEMMGQATHLLYDFVDLSDDYNVYRYQQDLRATLKRLEEEDKGAIIAGGTGLYIRAALYDYDFPQMEHLDMSEYEALSDEELFTKLKEVDPLSCESIHPHNRIRVLRALEVYLATGKPKSSMIEEQEHKPIFDCAFFALEADRAPLYERVDARVEEMFEQGLVEENRALIEKYGRTPRAFAAIGVKELFPYFDGQISLEEAKAAIKKNTRNYVKRQETFFRHQFDAKWIKDEEEILEALGLSQNIR